jgi:hypothetical protein
VAIWAVTIAEDRTLVVDPCTPQMAMILKPVSGTGVPTLWFDISVDVEGRVA